MNYLIENRRKDIRNRKRTRTRVIVLSAVMAMSLFSANASDLMNAPVQKSAQAVYVAEKPVVEPAKETVEVAEAEVVAKEVTLSRGDVAEVKVEEIKTEEAPAPAVEKNPQYLSRDVSAESNVTAEQLDGILEGTKLEGLGWAYLQAEKEYGVNAVFLVSLTALESGWGKHVPAKNNISGYMAYNGSETVSAKGFDSKADCIMVTAKLIRNNYLSEDGKYFNGLSIRGVNKRYSVQSSGEPNYSWSEKINRIADGLIDKIQG